MRNSRQPPFPTGSLPLVTSPLLAESYAAPVIGARCFPSGLHLAPLPCSAWPDYAATGWPEEVKECRSEGRLDEGGCAAAI